MRDEIEPALTLEKIADFHRQLGRLHAAGLRLQIDDGNAACHDLPNRLNEIMASVASRLGKAKPVEQVLVEAPDVPLRYRLALESWSKCDQPVESLDLLRAPVQQDSENAIDLRFALLLPVVIITLVYCASFYLLLVMLPRIDAIYLQLGTPPSLPVRCLLAIRSAAPVLGPALPLLGLFVGWLIFTGRLALPRWLPGRAQAAKYLSASLVAENLAIQVEHQPDDSPSSISQAKSTELKRDAFSRALNGPMLRWAISEGQPIKRRVPLRIHRMHLRLRTRHRPRLTVANEPNGCGWPPGCMRPCRGFARSSFADG